MARSRARPGGKQHSASRSLWNHGAVAEALLFCGQPGNLLPPAHTRKGRARGALVTAVEAPSQPQAESREPAPAASLLYKTGWSALAACGIVIARFAVTVFTARHLG